jgi:hypothetical protein
VGARTAEPLTFDAFDSTGDPLSALRDSAQGQYLRWYLADLAARSVIVEPAYFDRDYLSEFAAFYCTSTAGYPNVCRRVHYFAETVDRTTQERAVEADNSPPRRSLRHHRQRVEHAGVLPCRLRRRADPTRRPRELPGGRHSGGTVPGLLDANG